MLKTPGFESCVGGDFLPDGKRVLFSGTETAHKPRLYVMDIGGGTPRPITPEGIELIEMPLKWISPDGKLVFAADNMLHPLGGGAPIPIAGLAPGDAPGWTTDSESLFVQDSNEDLASLFRVHWKSGRRELFHEFRPIDPTQVVASIVLVSPDGKAWVYTNLRVLGDLYVAEGLK